MNPKSASLKRHYLKISTLKSRLTKAKNREQFIREQIKERAASDKPIFAGDFARWRHQILALNRRIINLRARLRNAQEAQEIELQKQKALDAKEPAVAANSLPPLEDKHRVGMDSSGASWHPWQDL